MTERARIWAFRAALAPVLAGALALDAWAVRMELAALARAQAGGLNVALDLVLLNLQTPLAVLLAAALAWRARQGSENRLLAVFLTLVAYLSSSDAYWRWAAAAHPPAWLSIAVDNFNAVFYFAGVAVVLRFSSVFPLRLAPQHLARPGARLSGVGRLRAALLRPRFVWLLSAGLYLLLILTGEVAAAVLHPVPAAITALHRPLLMLTVALLLGGIVAAAANLRTGARFTDPAGRRRLFWLLEGFLAGAAILVLGGALVVGSRLVGGPNMRGAFGVALYLAVLVILAGMAISVFFSGALDPGLAIRRTAVFGLVGLTMVFVFAGVENAMQNLVADRLGMSDHLSGLVSGGLVALLFDPIKGRCDRLVERWSGRAPKGQREDARADAPLPEPARPPARRSG